METIGYLVSNIDIDNYEVFVKRQPGVIDFLYKLNINGSEVFDGKVEKDMFIVKNARTVMLKFEE